MVLTPHASQSPSRLFTVCKRHLCAPIEATVSLTCEIE